MELINSSNPTFKQKKKNIPRVSNSKVNERLKCYKLSDSFNSLSQHLFQLHLGEDKREKLGNNGTYYFLNK